MPQQVDETSALASLSSRLRNNQIIHDCTILQAQLFKCIKRVNHHVLFSVPIMNCWYSISEEHVKPHQTPIICYAIVFTPRHLCQWPNSRCVSSALQWQTWRRPIARTLTFGSRNRGRRIKGNSVRAYFKIYVISFGSDKAGVLVSQAIPNCTQWREKYQLQLTTLWVLDQIHTK